MSTAARKYRKREGEKFTKEPKVGTPVEQRSWFTAVFPGLSGTKHAGRPMPRSAKKRAKALRDRGIEVSE